MFAGSCYGACDGLDPLLGKCRRSPCVIPVLLTPAVHVTWTNATAGGCVRFPSSAFDFLLLTFRRVQTADRICRPLFACLLVSQHLWRQCASRKVQEPATCMSACMPVEAHYPPVLFAQRGNSNCFGAAALAVGTVRIQQAAWSTSALVRAANSTEHCRCTCLLLICFSTLFLSGRC